MSIFAETLFHRPQQDEPKTDSAKLKQLTDAEINRHWRMAKKNAAALRRKMNRTIDRDEKKALRLKSRFTIHPEFLRRLAVRQKERCYYTDSKLKGVFRAALVRKNPQRGWVQGNVVWAAYPIALAKRHFPDDAFFGLAKRVARVGEARHLPCRPIKKIRKDRRLGQGGSPHAT